MIYAVHKNTKEHRVAEIMPLKDTDWAAVKADPDGWIKWHGGECPLPHKELCAYKLRGGAGSVDDAGDLSWEWADSQSDIIAYRPVLDDDKKESKMNFSLDSDGLPSIGSICEYDSRNRGWVGPAKVFAKHSSGGAFIEYLDHEGWDRSNDPAKFRPVLSEEDKVVEEMLRHCPYPGSKSTEIDCRSLYRAGYRKT